LIIRFPHTLGQASASPGEFRAGGTDLSERHASGVADGPIVDLRDLSAPGLREIVPTDDGGVRIGALVTLAQAAASDRVREVAPGLVNAIEGSATPQIRATGTVGGNLMQRVRCWYFRHPDVACLKKGGTHCYARVGDHRLHSCIDLGPCLAPHPSTVALALLAYGGSVETHEAGPRTMDAFFGDGADPHRENALGTRELVTAVVLPPGRPEGAAYVRAKERAGSEWPLVDAVARVQLVDGVVLDVQVALGHAANRSVRLPAVEDLLRGRIPDDASIGEAAAAATVGVKAPPLTRYKLPIVRGVVQTVLELAAGRAGGSR
jgi:xanthine dehydrogenase YagS FAD-binding subunit